MYCKHKEISIVQYSIYQMFIIKTNTQKLQVTRACAYLIDQYLIFILYTKYEL